MERKISQLKFNYPILNFCHVAQVQMSTWTSFHSWTEMHENREPEDRIAGLLYIHWILCRVSAPTGEEQLHPTTSLLQKCRPGCCNGGSGLCFTNGVPVYTEPLANGWLHGDPSIISHTGLLNSTGWLLMPRLFSLAWSCRRISD